MRGKYSLHTYTCIHSHVVLFISAKLADAGCAVSAISKGTTDKHSKLRVTHVRTDKIKMALAFTDS